jgi:hypothetical protein
MGRDWYRVNWKFANVERDYEFSEFLLGQFEDDYETGRISVSLKLFKERIEEVSKKNKEFKDKYKDAIADWTEALTKISKEEKNEEFLACFEEM